MANMVEIILFNCSHYEKKDSVLVDGIIDSFTTEYIEKVDLTNLEEFIEKASSKFLSDDTDSKLNVTFVDATYKQYVFYTEEAKQNYNKNSELITKPNLFFKDCTPLVFFKDFEMRSDVVYILAFYDLFENEYHFFNYIERPMGPNVFISYGVRSLDDVLDSKCYYDIFECKEPSKSFDYYDNKVTYVEESVKCVIHNAKAQVKYLKLGGLFERERFITNKIPSYVLNVDCCVFSSGVILRYGLRPEPKYNSNGVAYCYKTIREKFCESADYRYQVLDLMCRVLAKHYINSGLVKKIDNWRKYDFDKINN